MGIPLADAVAAYTSGVDALLAADVAPAGVVGPRLPMRDLFAMAAAGAYDYLEVFDGHTGQIPHFGRAKRCATGARKLALFNRDRGCTCPGCTVDFYRTQAHHAVADWKRDGQTNVTDLPLACGAEIR
jgi:hypothetical protein